jgi:hypothetical protein
MRRGATLMSGGAPLMRRGATRLPRRRASNTVGGHGSSRTLQR